MKSRFNGNVVIVTGGSSGIGQAICVAFAREGAIVINADINVQGGKATSQLVHGCEGECVCIKTDVSTGTDVAAMVNKVLDRYKQVDILVNNAMICSGDDILETDEEPGTGILLSY